MAAGSDVVSGARDAASQNIRFEEKLLQCWICCGNRPLLPIGNRESERRMPLRIHCISVRFGCEEYQMGVVVHTAGK